MACADQITWASALGLPLLLLSVCLGFAAVLLAIGRLLKIVESIEERPVTIERQSKESA